VGRGGGGELWVVGWVCVGGVGGGWGGGGGGVRLEGGGGRGVGGGTGVPIHALLRLGKGKKTGNCLYIQRDPGKGRDRPNYQRAGKMSLNLPLTKKKVEKTKKKRLTIGRLGLKENGMWRILALGASMKRLENKDLKIRGPVRGKRF